MDTGKGKFVPLNADDADLIKEMEDMERQHPEHGGWFRAGEIIEIRGSRFRIKSVKPDELRLKLLPRK